MAGRKGRSGPPGNLNAARNGFQTWRRRRALPVEKGHVTKLVDAEEQDLVSHVGGERSMTAVERAIIHDNGMALGLILLALEEARARGCIVLTPTGWDLQPGLQRIKGLLDTRRQNLQVLGVKRREKDVSLSALLAQAAADDEGDQQ